MAVITGLCLLVLALLYLGKSLKHASFQKIHQKIIPHEENIALGIFAYGILGSILAGVFFGENALNSFLLFISNFLMIFLAIPLAYPFLDKRLKIENPVLKEELKNAVTSVSNYGYVMAGITGCVGIVALSTLA